MNLSSQLEPTRLRRRAMARLKSCISCECAFYTASAVDGIDVFAELMGTAHLASAVAPLVGQPLGLTTRAEINRVRKGWSLRAPAAANTNRFALLSDDLVRERLQDQPLWQGFYEPNDVTDQLRALFYRDRRFIGYIAAYRGEGDRFTQEDKRRVNAIGDQVRNDLVLAASLDAREDEPSHQMLCDERGKVIYASETASIWLTADRLDWLRFAFRYDRAIIPGYRLHRQRMEHTSWFFVTLSSLPSIRLKAASLLSPQQREMGRLASLGLTNAEIADLQGVSSSTVKYHLRIVFEVLGIESRQGLKSVSW